MIIFLSAVSFVCKFKFNLRETPRSRSVRAQKWKMKRPKPSYRNDCINCQSVPYLSISVLFSCYGDNKTQLTTTMRKFAFLGFLLRIAKISWRHGSSVQVFCRCRRDGNRQWLGCRRRRENIMEIDEIYLIMSISGWNCYLVKPPGTSEAIAIGASVVRSMLGI